MKRIQLSKQELAALAAVSTGATNAQVAEQLGLATGTVRAYLDRIRAKTGQRGRTELANYHSLQQDESVMNIRLSEDERDVVAKAVVRDYVHDSSFDRHGIGVLDRSRCDRIVVPAFERILADRYDELIRFLTSVRDDKTTPMGTAADIDQFMVERLGATD